MKPDDFEQRMQQQPLRQVPAEWRAAVLKAAQQAGTAADQEQPKVWWRELFWPCPQAWAGLAAIWAVILLVNFSTTEEQSPIAVAKTTPPGRLVLTAWCSEKMLAELMDQTETPVMDRPKTVPTRPRSDWRDGEFMA